MNINDYIKDKQPIIYQTFLNAIKLNKISHAYLLVGEFGTPLKEVALYLAKSLVCDSPNPLACNQCITCIRVDKSQYLDLIVCDGEKGEITKENIDHITSTFSKTAMEKKGVVIYVLHLIENARPAAINALLKFLEEPGKNTYAFLTTQNEARVLPTIISRSTRLKLKSIPREDIIKESINEGVNEEDASLLSYFYSDINTIKKETLNETYLFIKEVFNHLVNHLDNLNDFLYIVENEAKDIKNKADTHLLIDMLTSFFEDIIRFNNHEKIFLKTYDKIINTLSSNLKHIEMTLLEIMNARNKLDLNVSLLSVLEHLTNFIFKE